MHLDTGFLIDLQRERKKRESGPAFNFLKNHEQSSFALSVIVAMEYCEGFPDEDLWKADRFLKSFRWVSVSDAVAINASRIRRRLRQEGQLIPDGDVLIAASALTEKVKLVTANPQHFDRIEGLEIINYRTSLA